MQPEEFLNTIYLGDRACKGLIIDGWHARILLHVDVISRIRSPSGNWNYYTAEDIPDGCLVFTHVQSVRFDPSGPIPNDYITAITVQSINHTDYHFAVHVGSVDDNGHVVGVTMTIVARGVHLEDPRHPGEEIL